MDRNHSQLHPSLLHFSLSWLAWLLMIGCLFGSSKTRTRDFRVCGNVARSLERLLRAVITTENYRKIIVIRFDIVFLRRCATFERGGTGCFVMCVTNVTCASQGALRNDKLQPRDSERTLTGSRTASRVQSPDGFRSNLRCRIRLSNSTPRAGRAGIKVKSGSPRHGTESAANKRRKRLS